MMSVQWVDVTFDTARKGLGSATACPCLSLYQM